MQELREHFEGQPLKPQVGVFVEQQSNHRLLLIELHLCLVSLQDAVEADQFLHDLDMLDEHRIILLMERKLYQQLVEGGDAVFLLEQLLDLAENRGDGCIAPLPFLVLELGEAVRAEDLDKLRAGESLIFLRLLVLSVHLRFAWLLVALQRGHLLLIAADLSLQV